MQTRVAVVVGIKFCRLLVGLKSSVILNLKAEFVHNWALSDFLDRQKVGERGQLGFVMLNSNTAIKKIVRLKKFLTYEH